MKRFRHLPFLCLLLIAPLHAASLTIIQLQNRPVEEVIPIVEPMLGPGELITGQGFKLFLRASPETAQQVQEIVDAIDIAAKMLQISVFQGSKRKLDRITVSGNLQVETDNANIGVGNSNTSGAGNINYADGGVSIGGSASSQQLSQKNNPIHRLRVAAGTEAFIQTGSQVPYNTSYDSSAYKDVTTGFFVLPRVRGERVTLELRSFKNSLGNTASGIIETQSANTTITGQMGEWLKIGGVTEHSSQTQSGTASHSSSTSKRKDRIWIRADLVR